MTEQEMRNEIAAANRRADDYIHEAKLTVESTLATFRARLASSLAYLFVDVPQEDDTSMTDESRFFMHRLREIRYTLAQQGVNLE